MPVASIVIPCYNAALHLEETVAHAQAQSVSDIEIICVDDGSTDGTPALLASLAATDERIRIIHQENGGEGPARDAGLVAAQGEWLYFLDSDDLMEPTLLADAIAACEQAHADLVVFRTWLLNEQTGEERLCDWSFKRDWMPYDAFVPAEHPEHILNSFQNWVHNKLFRASFVREHDLRFQHVHRTADLLFTCRALCEASRIALLDKPLHHYRTNNPQSALATSDSYPLDFYEGFLALRASLEEHGTWELYHDSFVNWAIEGCSVNLRLARSLEGYTAIADTLRSGGLRQLDILGFPREKSDMPLCYEHMDVLANGSFAEGLFWLMATMRSERAGFEVEASARRMDNERLSQDVDRLAADCKFLSGERDRLAADNQKFISDIDTLQDVLKATNEALVAVTNSASFKIGRKLTAAPRIARDIVSHRNRS